MMRKCVDVKDLLEGRTPLRPHLPYCHCEDTAVAEDEAIQVNVICESLVPRLTDVHTIALSTHQLTPNT